MRSACEVLSALLKEDAAGIRTTPQAVKLMQLGPEKENTCKPEESISEEFGGVYAIVLILLAH